MKTITIIGGGASGTLLTVNLLRLADKQPLSINLIERGEKVGVGVAFSTDKDTHLLNVPAGKMGAFPDEIEHFHRWLKAGGHDLSEKDLALELKAAEQKKGPPQAMWPKVVDGKISKWYNEVTLLGQDNVWDPPAGSIDKVRTELGKKLGGEVKIDSFLRFGLGEGIEKKTEDLAAEVAKTISG